MTINPVSRKAYVTVDKEKLCLNKYYDDFLDYGKINYNIFYQRIRSYTRRGHLTLCILYDAITMTNNEWISFYGGGKHKPFIYQGKIFKEFIGIEFRSLSSFLIIIGEYYNYPLIKSRLARNYQIDKAIYQRILDTSLGRVYIIRCKLNNLVYVGQTIKSIDERFYEHLNSYKNNKENNEISRKLYKSFEDFGPDNFYIELLEDNIPNKSLAEREEYWIKQYDAINSGLNMIPANASCVGYGKEIIYQGSHYNSTNQAIRQLARENPNLPTHIIEKRIKNDTPLPANPRKHSKFKDAGTWMWRKWKSLKRHKNLCKEWDTEDEAGYLQFLSDLGFPPAPNLKIGRLDPQQPHSRINSKWMTAKEERELFSGNKITAFGKEYTTGTAFAQAFQISPSTLRYRLELGMTPEEAVSQKGKTSPQRSNYDGIEFKSNTERLKYIAKKFNITVGQAKNRDSRNIPFDHQPFKGNKICIEGKEFNSEKEAVTFFHISLSTYNKKKQKE